jgi:hypothetical protein
MADETQEKPGMPLGAKIFRKLKSGLSSLTAEATKMASEMDDCPAKADLGEVVNGLTGHLDGIGKSWGKYYKDHDLDAPDEEETVKADDEETETEGGDDEVDAALRALDLDDEDEDDGEMSPEEKSKFESEIKALELACEHEERLLKLGK